MSPVLPEQPVDLRERPVQVPLPLVPTQKGRFESFLPGPNLAVLQQLAEQVPPLQPVYLWGEAGSGKTHLLQAMAGAAEEQGLRVQWFDAAVPLPWELSAGCQLLVLDEVDAYTPEQQQQAFALCIEAQSQACPWASAGHLPPVDLPLREDLRSRLGWGQTHALQSLGEDQTMFALELEAERRGIELSAEVKRYLISRLSRDLASLMQLLKRLDDYSLSRARPVTVALLRDMLAAPAVPAAVGTGP
jgi:DnaA family protein